MDCPQSSVVAVHAAAWSTAAPHFPSLLPFVIALTAVKSAGRHSSPLDFSTTRLCNGAALGQGSKRLSS